MKTILIFAMIAALISAAPASADQQNTNIGQDIGKGMQLGGIANGTALGGAVAVAGSIVDIASGLFGRLSIDKESPEFKERLKKKYTQLVRFECYAQFKEQLAATPETTDKEINDKAEQYCSLLDNKVKDGTFLPLNRSRMQKYFGAKDVLPEGDEEIILYKLPSNPIPNCVETLNGNGHRLVQMAKKNTGK